MPKMATKKLSMFIVSPSVSFPYCCILVVVMLAIGSSRQYSAHAQGQSLSDNIRVLMSEFRLTSSANRPLPAFIDDPAMLEPPDRSLLRWYAAKLIDPDTLPLIEELPLLVGDSSPYLIIRRDDAESKEIAVSKGDQLLAPTASSLITIDLERLRKYHQRLSNTRLALQHLAAFLETHPIHPNEHRFIGYNGMPQAHRHNAEAAHGASFGSMLAILLERRQTHAHRARLLVNSKAIRARAAKRRIGQRMKIRIPVQTFFIDPEGQLFVSQAPNGTSKHKLTITHHELVLRRRTNELVIKLLTHRVRSRTETTHVDHRLSTKLSSDARHMLRAVGF